MIFGEQPPSTNPPLTLAHLTARHRANEPVVTDPTDYVGRHAAEPEPAALKFGRQ